MKLLLLEISFVDSIAQLSSPRTGSLKQKTNKLSTEASSAFTLTIKYHPTLLVICSMNQGQNPWEISDTGFSPSVFYVPVVKLNMTPLPLIHGKPCNVYRRHLPQSKELAPWFASLRLILNSTLTYFTHVYKCRNPPS